MLDTLKSLHFNHGQVLVRIADQAGEYGIIKNSPHELHALCKSLNCSNYQLFVNNVYQGVRHSRF